MDNVADNLQAVCAWKVLAPRLATRTIPKMEPKEFVYEEFLSQHIDVVEPGLRLVQRQFYLPSQFGSRGFVDILCRDPAGQFVVIEIKRSLGASRDAAAEILQYVGLLQSNHDIRPQDIRCIVVSSEWDFLRLPLSYMASSVGFRLDGLELRLDSAGHVVTRSPVRWINIKRLQPASLKDPYLLALYRSVSDRGAHMAAVPQAFAKYDVENYVVVTLDGPHDLPYRYGLCIAIEELADEKAESLIEQFQAEASIDADDWEPVQSAEEEILLRTDANLEADREFLSGTPGRLAGLLNDWWPAEFVSGPGLRRRYGIFNAFDVAMDLAKVRDGNEICFERFISGRSKDELDVCIQNLSRAIQPFPEWTPILTWNAVARSSHDMYFSSYKCPNILDGILRFACKADDRNLPEAQVFFLRGGVVYGQIFGVLCWDGTLPTPAQMDFLTSVPGAMPQSFLEPVDDATNRQVLSAFHLRPCVLCYLNEGSTSAYHHLSNSNTDKTLIFTKTKTLSNLVSEYPELFKKLVDDRRRKYEERYRSEMPQFDL